MFQRRGKNLGLIADFTQQNEFTIGIQSSPDFYDKLKPINSSSSEISVNCDSQFVKHILLWYILSLSLILLKTAHTHKHTRTHKSIHWLNLTTQTMLTAYETQKNVSVIK